MSQHTPGPRIEFGMPAADYHADSSISASFLRTAIKRTLAHAHLSRISDFEQSPAMKLGEALHCSVLEPLEFCKRFVAAPKIDRRSNDGKKKVDSMANAIRANDLAMRYLSSSQHMHEVSLFWDRDGLPCKARLDCLCPDECAVVDIKTTTDANPHAFERTILKYGYHHQAAWYLDGCERTGIKNATRFIFVVVESSAPFAVTVHEIDADYIAHASDEIDAILPSVKEAVRNIAYPAYAQKLNVIYAPPYIKGTELIMD